ncbi:unnamed protein product [Paramecium sonneborni]|uniref:Uncharacterized protein n=1 Tax=Paramecium sonneborni TaxID=65129 RepID=A0A8S1RRG9_9CILI|nr:unnamed protein product [Paramecium sonneborni]
MNSSEIDINITIQDASQLNLIIRRVQAQYNGKIRMILGEEINKIPKSQEIVVLDQLVELQVFLLDLRIYNHVNISMIINYYSLNQKKCSSNKQCNNIKCKVKRKKYYFKQNKNNLPLNNLIASFDYLLKPFYQFDQWMMNRLLILIFYFVFQQPQYLVRSNQEVRSARLNTISSLEYFSLCQESGLYTPQYIICYSFLCKNMILLEKLDKLRFLVDQQIIECKKHCYINSL